MALTKNPVILGGTIKKEEQAEEEERGEVGKKAKGGNRVEMDGTASRVVADSRDESGTGAQPGTGNLVWMSPVQLMLPTLVWVSIQTCKKTVFTKTAVTTIIHLDMKYFVKLSWMEMIC